MDRASKTPNETCRQITAKVATFSVQDGIVIFGFADDEYDPKEYLTMMLTTEPDEQDFRLNSGGVYIEINDQKYSGYNLVEDINRNDKNIIIKIRQNSFQKLGFFGNIIIEYAGAWTTSGASIDEAIGIFKERIFSWDTEASKFVSVNSRKGLWDHLTLSKYCRVYHA